MAGSSTALMVDIGHWVLQLWLAETVTVWCNDTLNDFVALRCTPACLVTCLKCGSVWHCVVVAPAYLFECFLQPCFVFFGALSCSFFRSKPTATEVNETECATQKAPWKPCGFRNWCFYSIWFSHVFPRQRIAWRNVAITTPASVAGGSLINLPWHFAIDSMKCIWLLESIHSQ